MAVFHPFRAKSANSLKLQGHLPSVRNVGANYVPIRLHRTAVYVPSMNLKNGRCFDKILPLAAAPYQNIDVIAARHQEELVHLTHKGRA